MFLSTLLCLLSKFFSILPQKVFYLLSDLLYVLVYYVIRYRKKIVEKNLKNSFPEKALSEINFLKKKFYKNFCDIILESMALQSWKADFIKKKCEIKNREILDDL